MLENIPTSQIIGLVSGGFGIGWYLSYLLSKHTYKEMEKRTKVMHEIEMDWNMARARQLGREEALFEQLGAMLKPEGENRNDQSG